MGIVLQVGLDLDGVEIDFFSLHTAHVARQTVEARADHFLVRGEFDDATPYGEVASIRVFPTGEVDHALIRAYQVLLEEPHEHGERLDVSLGDPPDDPSSVLCLRKLLVVVASDGDGRSNQDNVVVARSVVHTDIAWSEQAPLGDLAAGLLGGPVFTGGTCWLFDRGIGIASTASFSDQACYLNCFSMIHLVRIHSFY